MKKIMKTLSVISLSTVVFSLAGNSFTLAQSSLSEQANQNSKGDQISQEGIDKEVAHQSKTRPVAEALAAIEETRLAKDFLTKNNSRQAKQALERALGKIDVLLANNPTAGLVPISIDVRIVDTKIDDATLKRITDEVKAQVLLGRYQRAKLLLTDLASEMEIETVNLPLATYPSAIRAAAGLVDKEKLAEAKTLLLAALHSLAIVETAIPLPVIRAQAIVDEVALQTKENKIDKSQAVQLLTEADQQLTWADKLGYGSANEDFKSLHASIKQLKEKFNSNGEPKGLLAEVKNELELLRQKIVSKL